MKTILTITLILSAFLILQGQEYTTDYPIIKSSNSPNARIIKVISNKTSTKVLLEVTGQSSNKASISFSKWTVLIPYNNTVNLTDLRDYDLNIPELEYTTPEAIELWNRVAKLKYAAQAKTKETTGEFLIKDIGELELDKKYSLKSKPGEKFQIWMTFGKLSPGVEDIMIMELIEKGQEWIGIKIKNPDTSPKTKWTEISLKSEWDKNGILPFEGIYENTIRDNDSPKYRLALKYEKPTDSYSLIYLSGADFDIWKVGDVKAYISKTASTNIYKVKWYLGNKNISEDLYISFEQGTMKIIWTDGKPEQIYLKLFPTTNTDYPSNSSITSSGTGFAISSKGIIATNYHVIQDAKNIFVKGINGNFSNKFKAKVLIEDKNNDLAIIKIEDVTYKNISTPPYTFDFTISDVGTSVYALGYPLRASMGEEVKLTNGIVSSKTGYQGDITTYQISVPVQPGNSGGPLLNSKGNVIGIVNAKLAGAENASYAIKAMYLMNLFSISDYKITLPQLNKLNKLDLPNQVKLVKDYIYIIETN